MISASASMQTPIAGRVTSLAHLWLITRTDGQVFGFTSHNEDITYDGVTYTAAYGFNPAAIAAGVGLAVSNTELTAVFNSAYMTEEDLRGGVWDHADVRIRLINWADTSQENYQTICNMGVFSLPVEYKAYSDVFSMNKANTLPYHNVYDLQIDFIDNNNDDARPVTLLISMLANSIFTCFIQTSLFKSLIR